ncbi:hypothetical protein ACTXT7_005248 [Hymenolepis weldensis]
MESPDFVESVNKLNTYCASVLESRNYPEAQLINHTESCKNFGSCIVPRCAFTKSLVDHLKDYPSKGQNWRQFVPLDIVRVIVQHLTTFIFPSKSGMVSKDFISEYQKELEIFSEIMRLKIPAPVQTWFNTLSTSAKGRPLAEEELNTSSPTNAASPSVATPLVIEALQNLCYEIFALPVCTAHAVTVAQTICGHIYGLAQSTDPSLQLLVLDLLPTLVHCIQMCPNLFHASSFMDQHSCSRSDLEPMKAGLILNLPPIRLKPSRYRDQLESNKDEEAGDPIEEKNLFGVSTIPLILAIHGCEAWIAMNLLSTIGRSYEGVGTFSADLLWCFVTPLATPKMKIPNPENDWKIGRVLGNFYLTQLAKSAHARKNNCSCALSPTALRLRFLLYRFKDKLLLLAIFLACRPEGFAQTISVLVERKGFKLFCQRKPIMTQ